MPKISDPFFAPARVKVLRRILMAVIVLAGLIGLLAIWVIVEGGTRYGGVLLGINVVVGACAFLARRAIDAEDYNARRLTILTAVLAIVFALPLGPVGLLFVVAGIGLIFVTMVRDREPR